MGETKLWYDRPAEKWTEALPLGNGRIGLMDDGGQKVQTLFLNEDTFWSGFPKDFSWESRAGEYETLWELTRSGRRSQAEELARERFTFPFGESYEPVGEIRIRYPGGKTGNYRRSLDMGTARTETQTGDQIRRALVSYPRQVAALHVTAQTGEMLSMEVELDAPLRHEIQIRQEKLTMLVQAPSLTEPSYSHELQEPVQYWDEPGKRGVRACVVLELRHRGGTLEIRQNRLCLSGAEEATLLAAIRTSFRRWDLPPDVPDEVLWENCRKDLQNAPGFAELEAEHEKDVGRFFDRVSLELEGHGRPELPFDRRLREFDPERPDLGLYELLFQYGRYLMIAGSRPGTQALTLQGIWNREVRPPWSSNYTLNINTQMNYWPVLSCGLEEMELPLWELIRDLTQAGEKTARLLYGAPGSVVHHNTDLWRFTWPVGNQTSGCVGYGFFPMAGAWLCCQLAKRYEYLRRDRELREMYPLLKAAGEFLQSQLRQESDGSLIVGPGTSPENSFLAEGKRHCLDKTTAMGLEITRELLESLERATEVLGEDQEFGEGLKKALQNLRRPEIGPDGTLCEWNGPRQEAEPEHRHISHLYSVYPGDDFLKKGREPYLQAARRSLERRGDEATGWSMAWKACQWARHREGDRALRLMNMQIRPAPTDQIQMKGGGTYPNGFCAHPPFQIDGNFGFTAAVAELLLQCREDEILLLPALPGAWTGGSVRGLMATGRVRTEIAWRDGHGKARLTTDLAQTRQVTTPDGKTRTVELTPGKETVLNW